MFRRAKFRKFFVGVNIDQETDDALMLAGEGNRSEGVRQCAELYLRWREGLLGPSPAQQRKAAAEAATLEVEEAFLDFGEPLEEDALEAYRPDDWVRGDTAPTEPEDEPADDYDDPEDDDDDDEEDELD